MSTKRTEVDPDVSLFQEFNKVVAAQQTMTDIYGHLSATLTMGDGSNENTSASLNRFFTKFSEGINDAKHGLEVNSNNDEHTLGFELGLYARYLDAEGDMLFNRTSLMVDYQDANRLLDKAKPQKKEAAKESKRMAEDAYENCSDVARQELKTFHKERIVSMKRGLLSYGEAKVKTAGDTYALLAKTLSALQQFDV